jgi:hypothetical protein
LTPAAAALRVIPEQRVVRAAAKKANMRRSTVAILPAAKATQASRSTGERAGHIERRLA